MPPSARLCWSCPAAATSIALTVRVNRLPWLIWHRGSMRLFCAIRQMQPPRLTKHYRMVPPQWITCAPTPRSWKLTRSRSPPLASLPVGIWLLRWAHCCPRHSAPTPLCWAMPQRWAQCGPLLAARSPTCTRWLMMTPRPHSCLLPRGTRWFLLRTALFLQMLWLTTASRLRYTSSRPGHTAFPLPLPVPPGRKLPVSTRQPPNGCR